MISISKLGTNDIDKIESLINNNYILDPDNIVRVCYPHNAIKWILHNSDIILGALYDNDLVGIIIANKIKMITNNSINDLTIIKMFTVKYNLRNLGIGSLLLSKLFDILKENNFGPIIFSSNKIIKSSKFNLFSSSFIYSIPINYKKIIKIGFLDNMENIPLVLINSLSLLKKEECNYLANKLNYHLSDKKIRPLFDESMVKKYIFPKKDVVYTFVKRDEDNMITDLITIYKYYHYCIDSSKYLSIGHIVLYFNETMEKNDLIDNTIDKLKGYNFDQITFKDQGLSDIKSSVYTDENPTYFYFENYQDKLDNDKIIWFPY